MNFIGGDGNDRAVIYGNGDVSLAGGRQRLLLLRRQHRRRYHNQRTVHRTWRPQQRHAGLLRYTPPRSRSIWRQERSTTRTTDPATARPRKRHRHPVRRQLTGNDRDAPSPARHRRQEQRHVRTPRPTPRPVVLLNFDKSNGVNASQLHTLNATGRSALASMKPPAISPTASPPPISRRPWWSTAVTAAQLGSNTYSSLPEPLAHTNVSPVTIIGEGLTTGRAHVGYDTGRWRRRALQRRLRRRDHHGLRADSRPGYVHFTLDPSDIRDSPADGQYVTEYFNRTPSFNRPGGESE